MSTIGTKAKENEVLRKLQSVVELLKNFRDNSQEDDNRVFLAYLGEIREILISRHISKPLSTKEVEGIESCLKDLKRYVEAMALGNLFHELKELKCRMDVVERRGKQFGNLESPKSNFVYDDDGIWRRISTKREELLGKSSLWLNAKPPRSVYKVRFDLGSKLPVRIGKTKKSEKEDWQDTNDHTKTDLEVFSTDRLFYNRIDKHQRFLEERKAYIREARQRRKSSSRLISTADSTAEKSKRNFQRVRNPPFGLIASDTANALRMRANAVDTRDVVLKVETPTNEPGANCGECRRLMKERDRFWGLESDSEEDCKIQSFNNRIKRRSSTIDLSTEQAGKNIAGCWSSFPWRSRGASRVKPSKLVGRGTWTSSVYVPPWQSRAAYRRRSNFLKPVQTVFDLEKARFGPKKGMVMKFLSRLTGNRSPR